MLGGAGLQGTRSALGPAGRGPHLRNILQALQLVALSNVYIWKLWWLAVALSGLMFDLTAGKGAPDSLSPEPGSARCPARARASGGGSAAAVLTTAPLGDGDGRALTRAWRGQAQRERHPEVLGGA